MWSIWVRTGRARMLSSRWMTVLCPGRVRDLQSCFNLNSLSLALKEGESGDDLEAQPYQFKAFRALLEALEVDEYEAVQLTDAIRDWTDKDTQLVSSNGAEDAYYEGLNPPYLVANQWLLGTGRIAGRARGEQRALRPARPLRRVPCPATSWW